MDINKLLNPNKICVVGASDKSGFGGDTCRNILEYMEAGSYFFVNPKRDEIMGVSCYHSIAEVPEDFDLVVICTPQATVPSLLRQAAARHAGGAVVFASGYAEVGTDEGRQAQQELTALCHELDIALMGPNCAGFVNYTDGKYPFAFLSQSRDRRGSVGLISQSGQICLSLMDSPQMKFSYAISAGNSAVVQIEDYLAYLVKDENTRVVALYLEGIKNPVKFIDSLATAARMRKPVVVLKTGRSEKGGKIAASHTGSLSGADKVFDAIFRKFGVIRVDDIEELMAVSQMFSVVRSVPQGARVASMNLSGGETGICADVGSLSGIRFPNFTDATMQKLTALLPSYAHPSNPLDMTASLSYDTDAYAQALRTVMQDDNIDLVAIGYTLLEEIADPAICFMTEAIERVAKEPNCKPMVMVPFVENTRNPQYAARLEAAGVPVLPPAVYAFKCIDYLCRFASYLPARHQLEIPLPVGQFHGKGTALTEHESKLLLGEFGITIPREQVARNSIEAVKMASQIGYPLVMKIDSKDIMHKSDAGCVKLNIGSAQQVEETFAQIIRNAKEHNPSAHIGGVLMQQMLEKSTEIILGVTNDPQFGPMLMCGLGGVFVEMFKDIALYPVPINRFEANEMLTSLRSFPLLTGYRGSRPLDTEALCDVMIKLSDLAVANKDRLLELDLNPVFVYEKGVAAADALAVLKS